VAGQVVTLFRVTADEVVTQAKSAADKRAMLGVTDDCDLPLAGMADKWSQDVFIVDELKSARLSVGFREADHGLL
jgi:hypothetical protein